MKEDGALPRLDDKGPGSMGRNPAHGSAPLSRVGGILHQGGERRNQVFALKSRQVFPLVLAPIAGNLRGRPEPETRLEKAMGPRIARRCNFLPRAASGYRLLGRRAFASRGA